MKVGDAVHFHHSLLHSHVIVFLNTTYNYIDY